MIPKEILNKHKKLYQKIMKLLQEDYKHDPISQPHRSHYKARDMLNLLKHKLMQEMCKLVAGTVEHNIYKVILMYVMRDIAHTYIFTKDHNTAANLFKEVLEMATPHKMCPDIIILYCGILNHYGVTLHELEQSDEALKLLLQLQSEYEQYKQMGVVALTIYDVFAACSPEHVVDLKGNEELEAAYTLGCFHLAHVYGCVGNKGLSAEYCHKTLERQLHAPKFDELDFALNAASLSHYFLHENHFTEARHHLAAASYIMNKMEAAAGPADLPNLQRRRADVARCWTKYGLMLLDVSRDRLNDSFPDVAAPTGLRAKDYRFEKLDLLQLEQQITDQPLLNFADAKKLYHFVIKQLNFAKQHIKAEDEASEYGRILLDFAELYNGVAFFETNALNQIKMFRRAAKHFEELLQLLNPQHYGELVREALFGAGKANQRIQEKRLEKVNEMLTTPNAPDVAKLKQKANEAGLRSIEHLKNFLTYYMNEQQDCLKKDLAGDETRVLYAVFFLGRLYFKLFMQALKDQVEQLENSYKYYKLFVDESEARKDSQIFMNEEIGVCRQMVELIPLKIANLRKNL